MWDIRATRICDTLAWFPTKVQMPLASFNDLILSGIHDIVHALRHPSAGAPLAPLTDSHVNAITTLTMVLTSLVAPPPPPLHLPARRPSTHLRPQHPCSCHSLTCSQCSFLCPASRRQCWCTFDNSTAHSALAALVAHAPTTAAQVRPNHTSLQNPA
jgi:hypothetical protein